MSALKTLVIDEKWAVQYDPTNNDSPKNLLRYGENAGDTGAWNNAHVAMFYALLDRTDLSQAAVAAALEAAANEMWPMLRSMISRGDAAKAIRALITIDQHDALSAHVAAEVADARLEMINSLKDEIARQEGQGGEGSSLWCVIDGERTIHEFHAQERMDARVRAEVAKARAEDAAKIAELVDTVKRLSAACDAMWNDNKRLERNHSGFGQPWKIKEAHVMAISGAQQNIPTALAQIGAKP